MIVFKCATCGKEHSYEKTPNGGRPRKFCDIKCKNAKTNSQRMARIIAEHKIFQKIYDSFEKPMHRNAFICGLVKRYQQVIETGSYATRKTSKGKLTFNQVEALTNSFIFGKNNPNLPARKEDEFKSIYCCFIAVMNQKGLDPYAHRDIKQTKKIKPAKPYQTKQ